MILTKDSNDNWSTVAAGAGTWTGTKAAWEAGLQAGTIPANTVGLITDDAEEGSAVTSGTVTNIGNWVKYGKVVHFVMNTTSTYLPDGGTFTLPFKPVLSDSVIVRWGTTTFGYIDLSTNGTVTKRDGTNANMFSSFTYITND